MPRILLAVEGNTAVGLGHVVRSLHLARQFEDMGAEVAGFWIEGDAVAAELVNRTSWLCGTIPEDVTGAFRCIEEQEVNFLLFDHTSDVTSMCRELRSLAPELFICALDPPVPDTSVFDAIVTLFMHHTEVVAKSDNHYIGLEFAQIRSEFLSRRGPVVATRSVGDVLVTFGGTDPSEATLKVMQALSRTNLPLHAHIVIGPGFGHREQIHALVADLPMLVSVYDPVDDMAHLMSRCDLGIISAGTTLMEMCVLGKPTITLAHNPAESRFASAFQRNGATRFLGEASRIEPRQIGEVLHELCMDSAQRSRIGQAGKALIDGNGAERSAATLLERFHERHKR